ncbi:MAG: hypothetical protein GF308_00835 [Candidatus Heimdallarchaeota archaeon]|nr:hypothetical protein [Candidatus Heimdallarchaeota archaeon]
MSDNDPWLLFKQRLLTLKQKELNLTNISLDPSPSTDLLNVLKGRDSLLVRQQAAWLLGERKIDSAIPDLLAVFERSEEKALKITIIWALTFFDKRKDIDKFFSQIFFSEPDQDLRYEALAAHAIYSEDSMFSENYKILLEVIYYKYKLASESMTGTPITREDYFHQIEEFADEAWSKLLKSLPSLYKQKMEFVRKQRMKDFDYVRELLQASSVKDRSEAIYSLYSFPSKVKQIVAILFQHFSIETDSGVRKAIIRFLVKNDREGLSKLLLLLERDLAIDEFKLIIKLLFESKLINRLEIKQLFFLQDLCVEKELEVELLKIIRVIASFDSIPKNRLAVPVLIRKLESYQKEVHGLKENYKQSWNSRNIRQKESICLQIISILGEFKVIEGLPILGKLLEQSSNNEIFYRVVNVLASYQNQKAVGLLIDSYNRESDLRKRFFIVESLSKCKNNYPFVLSAFQNLFRSLKKDRDKKKVVTILQSINSSESYNLLKEFLPLEESIVFQKFIISHLSQMDLEKTQEFLLSLLTQITTPQLKEAALTELCNYDSLKNDVWQEFLQEEGNLAFKKSIKRYLPQMDQDKISALLFSLLVYDESSSLKQAVLKQLANCESLPNNSLIPLRDFLYNDEDSLQCSIRHLALLVLGKNALHFEEAREILLQEVSNSLCNRVQVTAIMELSKVCSNEEMSSFFEEKVLPRFQKSYRNSVEKGIRFVILNALKLMGKQAVNAKPFLIETLKTVKDIDTQKRIIDTLHKISDDDCFFKPFLDSSLKKEHDSTGGKIPENESEHTCTKKQQRASLDRLLLALASETNPHKYFTLYRSLGALISEDLLILDEDDRFYFQKELVEEPASLAVQFALIFALYNFSSEYGDYLTFKLDEITQAFKKFPGREREIFENNVKVVLLDYISQDSRFEGFYLESFFISALELLGEIRSEEAMPLYIEFMDKTDFERPAVRFYDEDKFFYLRLYVTEALGKLGPKATAAVPILIERTRNDHCEIVLKILWALGEIGGQEAIYTLKKFSHGYYYGLWECEGLKDTSEQALRKLGLFREKDIDQLLEETIYFYDYDEKYDLETFIERQFKEFEKKFLRRARNYTLTELIVRAKQLLKQDLIFDERAPWQVAYLLSNHNEDLAESLPILLEALKAEKKAVRHFAIFTLLYVDSKYHSKIVPKIRAALESEKEELKEEVFTHLGIS